MIGYPWAILVGMLSSHDRARLARSVGTQADAQALGEVLANRTRIAEAVRQTSRPARDLLRRLWLAGGQTPVPNLYRLPPATRDAVPELAHFGLLVQLWVDYYQQFYALPLEVQQEVARSLLPDLVAPKVKPGPTARPAEVPAHDVWFTDLFRVLSHLRWVGGPVTQQGELYKRTKNQIIPLLWPQHPVPPAQRLELLIDYGLWAHLIQYDRLNRRFEVTEEAERFFDRPPQERWQSWFDYWIHVHVGRSPAGPVIWDLLAMAPGSGRIPSDALVELVAGSGLVARDLVRSAANGLTASGRTLGWLDVDQDGLALSARARGVLARRFLPEAPTRAVVQPNADVLVPVETPLGLVWRAEETLTLQQADVVWTYRFDAPALERGINLPLTADEALERLAALSRAELPENVVEDVRDGYRRADRVRILETLAVVGQNREITDMLLALLQDLVAARLADTVLAVPPQAAPEVIRRLHTAGYPVRSRPERPGAEPTRGLAKVVPAEPVYRPTLSVNLPGAGSPGPRSSRANDPAKILSQAIRKGEIVRVVYLREGENRMYEADLRPFTVADGVLRGVALDTLKPIAVPMSQILEVRWI